MGTQICAGSNIIANFLDDFETKSFLELNGVGTVKFQQYCKGNSSLGLLVESCVKQVKHLIFKSISRTVLNLMDFEFLIAKAVHLINRRPIAFKEALRTAPESDTPVPITPESLVKGRDLVSINVVPYLQVSEGDSDPDWVNTSDMQSLIRTNYGKLRKVREKLIDSYHSEFISNLSYQAVNQSDRFKPTKHHKIYVNDLVLLKDKFLKPSTYPLAVVLKVNVNSLGEVTSVIVRKGNNRESVWRHSSTIIPFLSCERVPKQEHCGSSNNIMSPDRILRPPRRAAAMAGDHRVKQLIDQDLV